MLVTLCQRPRISWTPRSHTYVQKRLGLRQGVSHMKTGLKYFSYSLFACREDSTATPPRRIYYLTSSKHKRQIENEDAERTDTNRLAMKTT